MCKIKTKTIAFYLITIFSLAFASIGHAAKYNYCFSTKQKWTDDEAKMHISTTSFPVGSSFRQSIDEMMDQWDGDNASDFTFISASDTDGTHNESNNKNEIYWQAASDEFLGVTYLRERCYNFFGTKYGFKEADIQMNSRYSWTSGVFDPTNYGEPYNFEFVMLHELGHALGLKHENRLMTVMHPTIMSAIGQNWEVHPHSDDLHGLRVLYPGGGSVVDIAALAFYYNTTAQSIYPSVLLDEYGYAELSPTRGNEYDVRYSIANHGTQDAAAWTAAYLSTNSYISTFDIPLGADYQSSITPRESREAKIRVQIPPDTPPGDYYIGYIVDIFNDLPEEREDNNTARHEFKYTVVND